MGGIRGATSGSMRRACRASTPAIAVDNGRDLVTIEDVGSTNGTFVGKARGDGSDRARDGDRIEIGSVRTDVPDLVRREAGRHGAGAADIGK